MTNEQAKRLDEAIAKAGLKWWEVQEKIGFEIFNNTQEIEATIAAIEKMAKTETTEEAATEAKIEVKLYTEEDAKEAVALYASENIYTSEQWENDGTFSAQVGQEVSEEVYYQMFNCLPPLRLPRECGYLSGFRMGEAYTNEQSKKTGELLAHYAAFGKRGGKYYFLGHLNKYGEMCSADKRNNRAIIYARGEQAGEQFGACIEYAKKHNLRVIDGTTDFDIVAKKVVGGEVDMVLVYDYTRLSRNTAEYEQMTIQLRGYGVVIIATK